MKGFVQFIVLTSAFPFFDLCEFLYDCFLIYFKYFLLRGLAWVGSVVASNDAHPLVQCSNKGICDGKTGECQCFPNYDGIACERTVCPNDCSQAGVCFTQEQLALEASRVYTQPWDARKHVGCVCDLGRRGNIHSTSNLQFSTID